MEKVIGKVRKFYIFQLNVYDVIIISYSKNTLNKNRKNNNFVQYTKQNIDKNLKLCYTKKEKRDIYDYS